MSFHSLFHVLNVSPEHPAVLMSPRQVSRQQFSGEAAEQDSDVKPATLGPGM